MVPKPLVLVLVLAVTGMILGVGATAMLIRARQAEAPPAMLGGSAVSTADIESSPDSSGLPVLFDAPTFSLVNQDDKPVTNESLKGHPYIAAFIFSNCTSVCPMISGRMSSLQEGVPSKAVKLVSFTVDPERDTPEVLKSYAAKFKADTSRWFFLTGTKEQMEAMERGFHVRLSRPAATQLTQNDDPMALLPHSDRFMLVDSKGRVRGVYDAKDETAMFKLKNDSGMLEAAR